MWERSKGLTSFPMPLKLSSEKETSWLLSPICRGSTRRLESQLTAPPCEWRTWSFTLWLHKSSNRWCRSRWNTHCLCFHTGQIEKTVSTFSVHRQVYGQIQEADGEVTCWNLWTRFPPQLLIQISELYNILRHVFFNIYITLTVKLNSGPMSSRVLTVVTTWPDMFAT